MAVRDYGGFSSGFAQGFGLIQNFYDTQDKKRFREQQRQDELRRDELTAEYRAQRLASDTEFRESEAERRSRESLATTLYRTEQQRFQAANEARDDARAQEELDFKRSPDNPVNMRAKIDFMAAERERRADENFTKRIEAAGNADEVYKLVTSGRALSGDDLSRVESLVQENKGTLFDIESMVDYVSQNSAQEILAFNQELAQGGSPQMSDAATEAYSRTLGIGKTAAVGRLVDDTFTNAPDYMKDGSHVVSGQGLYRVEGVSAAGGSAPTATATMYVNVLNQKTGEVYPYFPPLTPGRTPFSTEPLNIPLEQANPAAMAGGYMATQVGPVIKPVVRQARIQRIFGDQEKRTDGVAEFNKAVDDRLKIVRQAIQGGGNPSAYVIYMNKAEASSLLGKQLTEQQVAEIRMRIEDNLLFGTTRTPPQQFVREWLESTSSDINEISVTGLRDQGFEFTDENLNKKDRGQFTQQEVTLGQLLNEGRGLSSDNPQQVSEYNGIASDPKALAERLIELGLIRRTR